MSNSKFEDSGHIDLAGDEFVNIWTTEGGQTLTAESTKKDNKDFYEQWVAKSSGTLAIPAVAGADALRALYPDHSVILTQGYSFNILGFPAATFIPIDTTKLVNNLVYVPVARNLGTVPGILANNIVFGGFKVAWKQFEYIIYTIEFPEGFGKLRQYFILHKGPEEVSRLFLLAAGAWNDSLHDEIWVFNQGFWSKDHGLWVEVQKADWKDVILGEDFKQALQKDVYGFFSSEAIYKELAIPWKRGLIMHGPPGNGKTISLKAIMKTCGEKGFSPLYVKSFKSYKGEEGAMADVFDKARQLSPCVIILEDLDSLINDSNRSFFLNQLDGLEGNDGMLIIGTTNHFDRLDPALSTRPSRFDRKYLFDDPTESERKLYAKYWQTKLKSNKDINFPDELVDKVAHLTEKFSFAYLKEVFVSSLVTLSGIEGEKPTLESLLLKQIKVLRKQLDKPTTSVENLKPTHTRISTSPAHPFVSTGRGVSSEPDLDPDTNLALGFDYLTSFQGSDFFSDGMRRRQEINASLRERLPRPGVRNHPSRGSLDETFSHIEPEINSIRHIRFRDRGADSSLNRLGFSQSTYPETQRARSTTDREQSYRLAQEVGLHVAQQIPDETMNFPLPAYLDTIHLSSWPALKRGSTSSSASSSIANDSEGMHNPFSTHASWDHRLGTTGSIPSSSTLND